MTEDQSGVSIVIPCYNELANLQNGVLDEVASYLQSVDFDWEVVIVDDESTDGSGDFVAAWVGERGDARFRNFTIPHGGKPAAVWAGIQEATKDLVLFTDMDQSTPLEEWDKLRPAYEEGYDVVIGSRGGTRTGFNILRRAGSAAFRNIRRAFVLREILDTQCGFKSCRREAALKCFPQLEYFQQGRTAVGWTVTAYDVELLYLLQRAGYQIAEVDVRWWNRDVSETKANPGGARAQYIRESRLMLQEIVKVKVNQMRGMYD